MSFLACDDRQATWFVALPKGWRSDWLKWNVGLSTKRPSDKEQERLPYISNEDISSWTGQILNDDPQPATSGGRKFRAGDVLLNKLRPYLAKVYHAKFDGISSGELLCLRPLSKVLSRYLFYVLTSKAFIDAIDAETFGSKMPRADWHIVGHQPLPLPPLPTQRQIVRFLDEKTAHIDALIGKKRTLLNRLAEYRVAIITLTVTGGLEPGTSMKLFGVNRIGMAADSETTRGSCGDLAEGWTRRRLRFDIRLNPRKPPFDIGPDAPVSFVPMEAVGEYGGLNLDNVCQLEDVDKGYTYFEEGDLCIAKITPSFENGKGALAEGLTNGVGFGTTELHVVRPEPHMDRRFLLYLSMADNFRKIGASEMYGAAGQKRVDESFIKDWTPPMPPINTQRRIARFLDEKTAELDRLQTAIGESIERLHEFRTALITSAVTGRIDMTGRNGRLRTSSPHNSGEEPYT